MSELKIKVNGNIITCKKGDLVSTFEGESGTQNFEFLASNNLRLKQIFRPYERRQQG